MYLAIDLGGTKTLICVLDENGVVVKSTKFPTPQVYKEFLAQLDSSVTDLIEEYEIEKCCMAIPGIVDRKTGLIKKLGNLQWGENIEIAKDLNSIFSFSTFIENDANLAGLGEANLVLNQYRKSLYITVSTGIGSVYVIDGKIDQNTIDAEIGHALYNHDGKLVYWERMASGKWLFETFGKKASELEDEEIWRIFCKNLALGILNNIYTLTPDLIILGGGVGAHLDKFHGILLEEIEALNNNYMQIPPIVEAKRPEEAVIYGCFQLIKNGY